MFSTCTLCFKQQRKIFFAPLCVQNKNRIIEEYCTTTFAEWIAILLTWPAKAYEIKISNHLINIPTFTYWLFKLNVWYLFLCSLIFPFLCWCLFLFQRSVSHMVCLYPWKNGYLDFLYPTIFSEQLLEKCNLYLGS